MSNILDELVKNEYRESKKISKEVSILIAEPLYRWYLQQNLELKHNSKKRSHFCFLYLIHLYITNQLEEHSQDINSIVISDSFKDLIQCNSNSFNEIFNTYFLLTIEGSKIGKKVYANGYRLKEMYLVEIHELIFDVFEKNNSMSYVKINCDKYEEVLLYNTIKGLVETKKEALEIEGFSRRQESKLKSVKRKVLKKITISDTQIYKTTFHIPKGYFKYPIVVNEAHIIYLLRNNMLDKKTSLFFMHVLNIYKHYPFIIYKELSTGRLFGTTKINDKKHFVLINYQGMKKKYRKELFKDMYEYDISTAAPTILYQFYKKDFTKKLNHIESYIKNKKAQRIKFAKILSGDLECNIKIVKSTLTALFFGSNLLAKYSLLGEKTKKMITKAQLNTLLNDIEFKSLVLDVKEVFEALTDKHFKFKKGANEKVLTNMQGKKKKFRKKQINKAMAFLYQGIEVKIIHEIYKNHPSKVSLLIHDAIISEDPIDIKSLSDLVFKATGYNVEFEEEVISNE